MKKKVIYSIISAILIIPLFVRPVLADVHGPNNIVYTPYGTCTQEFYYDVNGPLDISIGGITFPSVYACNVIRYQFTKPTDGVFDLAVTPYTGVLDHQWYLYTTNCYLVSVTQDGKLRFAVEDQEYCEIAILTPNYNNQLVLFLQNQQLTQSDTTNEAVNNIVTYVEAIDDYIFNMKADTTTIKNILLNSLGGYVNNDGSLYTDMQSLKTALTTVNTKLDSINEAISRLNNTNWNNISFKLQYCNSLNGWYRDDLSQFGNITTCYVKIVDPNWQVIPPDNRIIEINAGLYSSYFGVMPNHVYLYDVLDQDGNSIKDNVLLYSDENSPMGQAYFNQNIYAGDNPVYLVYKTKNGYFRFNSNKTLFRYIDENNHNYWPVYNTLNEAKYEVKKMSLLENILTAIQNVSLNVNQLTVNATGITYNTNQTDVTNSVTNYNTNINQVFSIENNLSTDFNTYNQQFNPDFTESLQQIQSAPQVMNNIIVDLYNLPFIKYPLLITLAGIVLLAFLGV